MRSILISHPSFLSLLAFIYLLWFLETLKEATCRGLGRERELFEEIWAESIWTASSVSVASDSCQGHNEMGVNQDTYVNTAAQRYKAVSPRSPKSREPEHFAIVELDLGQRSNQRGAEPEQRNTITPSAGLSDSPYASRYWNDNTSSLCGAG